MAVHNHGAEDGTGLRCNEIRLPDGVLRGVCLLTADELAAAHGASPAQPQKVLEPEARVQPKRVERTPEMVARDVIVEYLGSSPLIRRQAEHAASGFGDQVDSAYLVGAALRLGSLSFEGILALMTRSIEAVLPALDADAAWAEHSIGFTWDSEEQRYGEERVPRGL